jgi:hypothetical protein
MEELSMLFILFLLLEIGVSSLTGMAVIALLLPLQILFARQVGVYQRRSSERTVRVCGCVWLYVCVCWVVAWWQQGKVRRSWLWWWWRR